MNETLEEGKTLNDGVQILARDRQLAKSAFTETVDVQQDPQPQLQDSTEAAA